MINFLRKIVDFTFYFICIILIIYICIVGYQRLTNKDVVSFFDKYYFFEVASSSMESELHINDLIFVKSYDNYKVGDIITYKVDDTYVTHRIVSISDDGIITKGDANGACDEMISVDEVVGKQFADQKFSRDIIQLAAVDRAYLCGALAAHKIQQGKVNFLVGGFDKGLADQLL